MKPQNTEYTVSHELSKLWFIFWVWRLNNNLLSIRIKTVHHLWSNQSEKLANFRWANPLLTICQLTVSTKLLLYIVYDYLCMTHLYYIYRVTPTPIKVGSIEPSLSLLTISDTHLHVARISRLQMIMLIRLSNKIVL